tara:strand:- start:859 stop:1401 length:543 start_codon:yes stop_codon:yes gene_type:complete
MLSIQNSSSYQDEDLPNINLINKYIQGALDTPNGPYFDAKSHLLNKHNNTQDKIIINKNTYPLLNISYVTNQEMQQINAKFRDKNKPTNILSFPAQAPTGMIFENHLGDLILAPEVISQEAKDLNQDLNLYYAHIFIHGVLHLKGYDHITDEDAEVMEKLEAKLILSLKLFSDFSDHGSQ